MKSFRHYVTEVVDAEVNEGDRHQRNVDYVNSHREALGYRKIGRATHPDEVRKHLARIDKHAPYGDDPWERHGNDYGRRSSSRNEDEDVDVEENRLERGGPRGYVEREGAKARDAQDKMLAQSEAEEKKPPFGKGKEDDGDEDEEGDEKKPPFGKKKGKDGDDDEDDSKDKKKGDKKPPFGKGKDEKRDDDKDDKKEESLAEHYLRLMGYPQG